MSNYNDQALPPICLPFVYLMSCTSLNLLPFPLCFCILQAIKIWWLESPANMQLFFLIYKCTLLELHNKEGCSKSLSTSLVNSLICFCLKIGDATPLKQYVLCNIKQWLKLRKSSKETARCRDHPCRSFRMPRNEDSQNMNPPSTSESPETIGLVSSIAL